MQVIMAKLGILFDNMDLLPRILHFLSYKDILTWGMTHKRIAGLRFLACIKLYLKKNTYFKELILYTAPSVRMFHTLLYIRHLRETFLYTTPPSLDHSIVWKKFLEKKNNMLMRPRRIDAELRQILTLDIPYITPLSFEDDGFMTVRFAVMGLCESFAGELFYFRLRLGADYPFEPPSCHLVTPVPSIPHGDLKIDIFGDKWSPALTLRSMMLGIASVLNRNDLSCFELPKKIEGEQFKIQDIGFNDWNLLFDYN